MIQHSIYFRCYFFVLKHYVSIIIFRISHVSQYTNICLELNGIIHRDVETKCILTTVDIDV